MRNLARGCLAAAAFLLSGCTTTPSGPKRALTPELCLDSGFRCTESGECCSGACALGGDGEGVCR